MPLIFGLLALALGVSLTVLWWSTAFVAALQVLFVTTIIIAGLIWCVVGYSELKAAREFAARADESEKPAPRPPAVAPASETDVKSEA